MGVVWRARDTILDRDLALKLIRPNRENPVARERFLREAKAAARIQHPNLVTIFDYGEVEGHLYLVMELVIGQRLSQVIQQGPLATGLFLQLALPILDGLAAIHEAGIVHRDLKPANIMVTPGHQVKLLDFGLAKMLDQAEEPDATVELSLTRAGHIVGTPQYMSPEQAMGAPVDQRSDIFSLGTVFFEMLTGRRLFSGTKTIETLRQLATPPIDPLRAPESRIHPEITRLVTQMLEPEVSARPQRVVDVREALQRCQLSFQAAAFQSGEAPTLTQTGNFAPSRAPNQAHSPLAPPSPTLTEPRQWRRAAVGALAFAVLCAGSWWLWSRTAGVSESGASAALTLSADPAVNYRNAKAQLLRYDRPGAIDNATQLLEAVIQSKPDYAAAHAALAEAYWRRNLAQADPHWQQLAAQEVGLALKQDPAVAHAHYVRGLLESAAGRRAEAEAAHARAADLDPSHARALAALASAEAQKGNRARALELWQKASQADQTDWMPHYSQGLFHYRQAAYVEAETAWNSALQVAPDNVIVLRNLGAALHMQNRRDRAAAAFQRALEIVPDAATYTNLGTLRYFDGQYAEAAALFEKAVDLAPGNYLNWGNLGDASRQVSVLKARSEEAYRQALRLAEETLVKTPASTAAISSAAMYQAHLRQPTEARQTLARLEALQPKPAEQFNAALAWETLGERDRALAWLERALNGGHSLEEARREPTLAKLRGDRRFVTLLQSKP